MALSNYPELSKKTLLEQLPPAWVLFVRMGLAVNAAFAGFRNRMKPLVTLFLRLNKLVL
jgi:hypothetical protein